MIANDPPDDDSAGAVVRPSLGVKTTGDRILDFVATMDALAANAEKFLERKGITVGDDAYKAHLEKTDYGEALKVLLAELANPHKYLNASRQEILESTQQGYQANASKIGAVRIIQSAARIKQLLDGMDVNEKDKAIRLASQYAKAMTAFLTLNLPEVKDAAVSTLQGDRKREGAANDRARIKAAVKSRLSRKDGSRFVWNSPTKKGKFKISALAREIVPEIGLKEKAIRDHISELIDDGELPN